MESAESASVRGELRADLQAMVIHEKDMRDVHLRAEIKAEVKAELQAEFDKELDARTEKLRKQFEQNLHAMRDEYSAEILALSTSIMRNTHTVQGAETFVHPPLTGSLSGDVTRRESVPSVVSSGHIELFANMVGELLFLSFDCLGLKDLGRACICSKTSLMHSDYVWKRWAVQIFNELELRADNSAWRLCLHRKVQEPRFTLKSIEAALEEAGENIWRFKTNWNQCQSCGYLFMIDGCGTAAETVPCPECGTIIGGQYCMNNDNTYQFESDAEAEAVLAATRTVTRSCLRHVEVSVLRQSACHGFVRYSYYRISVPRDCLVFEAMGAINQLTGIPVSRQTLLAGETVLKGGEPLLASLGGADSFAVFLLESPAR